jgi:Peptidase inhibitor family I36
MKSTRLSALGAAISIVLSTVLTIAVQSPAAADPRPAIKPIGNADCGNGLVCAWSGENFTGTKLEWRPSNTNTMSCVKAAFPGGHKAKSVANKADRDIGLYGDFNCKEFSGYNPPLILKPGFGISHSVEAYGSVGWNSA